jgi:hypothetical protein
MQYLQHHVIVPHLDVFNAAIQVCAEAHQAHEALHFYHGTFCIYAHASYNIVLAYLYIYICIIFTTGVE